MIRAIKARRDQAREYLTMYELSRLSDRELNDIGIGRGEIYGIAKSKRPYRRKTFAVA
jgi:uncharacterized protein YjiS (DUF1127 family)